MRDIFINTIKRKPTTRKLSHFILYKKIRYIFNIFSGRCLLGKASSPLSGYTIVLFSIIEILESNIAHERIVRIGIGE